MIAIFYISAVVAILATVMVITRLNAVHALLYLIVSLLSVAVIFYTLGAPFIAALEVIIYAGAIMVLFVFVMMILNLGTEAALQESQWLSPRMYEGPALLALILLAEFVYMISSGKPCLPGRDVVGPKEVGASLFGTYFLGAEIVAMMLLGALVGAFHLGRRIKD
jgi:NADH-quinone oxidoreductase subunit J